MIKYIMIKIMIKKNDESKKQTNKTHKYET